MKTLIGTPAQPWIDLSSYIDINGLHDIRLDIIRGIALSDDTFPTAYGTMLEVPKYKDGFYTLPQAKRSVDLKVQQYLTDVEWAPSTKETVRRRQLLFSNLAYGGYSGGWSVPIRALTGTLDSKNSPDATRRTDNTKHFDPLMDWINELPFVSIGRINIFVNTPYAVTPIHTDGKPITHTNDFMWLSTERKKLFIYDPVTADRYSIDSSAVFFDERVWHGTEQSALFQFSIRIDGTFTPEFKQQLGIDHLTNYCATAE